jgi:hypothetical protein
VELHWGIDCAASLGNGSMIKVLQQSCFAHCLLLPICPITLMLVENFDGELVTCLIIDCLPDYCRGASSKILNGSVFPSQYLILRKFS